MTTVRKALNIVTKRELEKVIIFLSVLSEVLYDQIARPYCIPPPIDNTIIKKKAYNVFL